MFGEFKLLILLGILRNGTEACGAVIFNEICIRGGRVPKVGAVYKALIRLEQKNMLTSQMRPARRDIGGRSRRCYTVTPSALRQLALQLRALSRMSQGVELPQITKRPESTDA